MSPVDAPVDAAVALLDAAAGRDADGVWSAPGRVNLIGEHTDYSDGFVLPIAIDRRTAVAAAARDDGRLRCWSTELGAAPVCDVAALVPDADGGWWAYVHGVVWALREAGVPVGGADLAVASTVPTGAGLSSSAAIEVATALACCDLAGVTLPPADLARAGRRAEWEWAGTPCGLMDQTAAVAAVAGHALLLDTRSLQSEQVRFDPGAHGLTLLVVDTRVTHALADGKYAERRRECEDAARVLGVPALRDATPAAVDAAASRLGPVLHRRARHVVTENARVRLASEFLRVVDWAGFGAQLVASHVSLRDDFEVSVRELDTAVDVALAAGALGARMTGGGFGGSAIALVPTVGAADVATAVGRAFDAAGFATPAVFPVRPADGARRER